MEEYGVGAESADHNQQQQGKHRKTWKRSSNNNNYNQRKDKKKDLPSGKLLIFPFQMVVVFMYYCLCITLSKLNVLTTIVRRKEGWRRIILLVPYPSRSRERWGFIDIKCASSPPNEGPIS